MEITSSEVNPLRMSSTPVYNNTVPQETYKALVGWLDDEWAAQVRSSFIDDTPEDNARAIADCKAHVAARPVFASANPVTEMEEDDLVKTIKARPEFSYIETEVQEIGGGNCRIAMINLNEVIAVQPIVRVDNLADRLILGPLSYEQLFALCFPPSDPSDTVTIDVNERGYTITALDPNIRVVPWGNLPMKPAVPLPKYKLHYPAASSPLEVQLFPFALLRVPNYLQVVHYQDRYILRNGYNRSVSLLYQHIHKVPCVLIETDEPDLVFRSDWLTPEIVMGERPPKLSDFWEEAVTCPWRSAATRRVYHISMEEIEVWR